MNSIRGRKRARRRALSAALLVLSLPVSGAGPATRAHDGERGNGALDSRRDASVEVWVDLTLPALGRVPVAERAQARLELQRQQDEVMRQLRLLGARELARVQIVRNAIAVQIDPAALPRARAVVGVRTVTPVRHQELLHP